MNSCRAANDKEIEDRVEDFRPVFFNNKHRLIGNIKFLRTVKLLLSSKWLAAGDIALGKVK